MKVNKLILPLLFLLSFIINAQSNKIFVTEDVFVQGGETRETKFGAEKSNLLMVFVSKRDTKFGRITFLKFDLPKNVKNANKMKLHIPIKVFNNTEDDSLLFKLDVYTVENNTWSENELTWDKKPDYAKRLGTISLAKSANNKNSWEEIELDFKVINDLIISQKSNTITLGLYNLEPNKTSAVLPSKEKSKKMASYITFE